MPSNSPKPQPYFTLGEASRLTRISRDSLRSACDVGRIPHQRGENGYRMIPAAVVERLRKHGLKNFPPVSTSSESPEPVDDQTTPKRVGPAERLGLLGQPSPKLQTLKERLEAKKMRLEDQQTGRELERLRREGKEERRSIAEETRRKREIEKAEQDRARLERTRAAEEERRRKWFAEQYKVSASTLESAAFWGSLDIKQNAEEISEELAKYLLEALRALGPASQVDELDDAREQAIGKALEPLRRKKRQREIVELTLRGVGPYLRELSEKGWIAIPDHRDLNLLAIQLEPSMRAALEREVEESNLNQTEARRFLHDAIDRRLKLI